MKLMIDLCSGLGGASQSFKDNGWKVITVDNEQKFNPTICADIRTLKGSDITTEKVTLVWASPPCTYFSRKDQPGLYPNEPAPSTELVEHCLRIIRELNPTYWVLENVRGSRPYITPLAGHSPKKCGAWWLWGDFPIMDPGHPTKGNWQHPGGSKNRNPAIRALIPESISKALRLAIEQQMS